MKTIPIGATKSSPLDLRLEEEEVLEMQVCEVSDAEAAELATYADQVEPDFLAGRLRPVSHYAAEWERKRRLAG